MANLKKLLVGGTARKINYQAHPESGQRLKDIGEYIAQNNLQAITDVYESDVALGSASSQKPSEGVYKIEFEETSFIQEIKEKVIEFNRDGRFTEAKKLEGMLKTENEISGILKDKDFMEASVRGIYKDKQGFSVQDIEQVGVAPIGWGQHNQVFVITITRKDGGRIQFVLKVAQLAGVEMFKRNIEILTELNQTTLLSDLVPKLGAVYENAELLGWSEEYVNAGGMDLRGWRDKLSGSSDQTRLRAIEKEAIRTYYLFYEMSGGGYIEDPGPGNVVISTDAQGRLYGKVIDIVKYRESASDPLIIEWLEPFFTAGYDYDPGLIIEVILEEGGQAELSELKNNFPEGEKWAKLRTVLNGLSIETDKESEKSKDAGGIDFRSLPIVIQSLGNLKAGLNIPQSSMQRIDLTREWADIERMVKSGITPSAQRLKEFLAASCIQGSSDGDLGKIVSCIADILRMEEESCSLTDPALKDILVVLDSGRSAEELKLVFAS